MFAAYSGNSAYCFSNSLQIALAHAGMDELPSIGQIECMTGMPFGATFLQFESPLFFPSPATMDPDKGLTRALEILGWGCELWRSDDEEEAQAKLQETLASGPALLGPLDMGFLSYDPSHQYKRGADHYIVALKLDGEMVQVHDPQSYPFAQTPIADLMRAWNGKELGYAPHAYTMRYGFHAERKLSRAEMLQETLRSAQALNQADADQRGPVVFGGAHAFGCAVDLVRNGPTDAFAGLLKYFVLPLGARRCIDAAHFLQEVSRPDAARLFLTKAETFGRAQYYTVQQQWSCATALLAELAQIEAKISASL